MDQLVVILRVVVLPLWHQGRHPQVDASGRADPSTGVRNLCRNSRELHQVYRQGVVQGI